MPLQEVYNEVSYNTLSSVDFSLARENIKKGSEKADPLVKWMDESEICSEFESKLFIYTIYLNLVDNMNQHYNGIYFIGFAVAFGDV